MSENQLEVADKTKLPAELRARMLEGQESIFFNVALFEHAQRVAEMFAKSTMLPKQFQGNVGNCMIALNYAVRIKADPFMVAQTMYIIHDKPGIEGKLVAALINQSGKYRDPLEYEWLNEKDQRVERFVVVNDQKRDGRGCRAVTVDARSGKPVIGPKVTWEVVHAEGWHGKPGSKWKTIPEIMFMYRAASWFANVHCPEVKLGMQTTEELKDMDAVDLRQDHTGTFVAPEDIISKIKDVTVTVGPKADSETQQQPPADETEGGKYNLWPLFKNLRNNYASEVQKSIKSGSIDKATPADLVEMKQKWERQVPAEYPWPMVERAPEEKPAEEEPPPSGKAIEYVTCPDGGLATGKRNPVEWCKAKCGQFEKCDAAQEASRF